MFYPDGSRDAFVAEGEQVILKDYILPRSRGLPVPVPWRRNKS